MTGADIVPGAADLLDRHLAGLTAALPAYRRTARLLARWGDQLARRLVGGGRLLVAGNGGSAAEAQHLTAELVGKLRDDREPFSAIALTAETSALTAIGNDYGFDELFARQVRAHGRPGDILLLLSTSGRSTNLVAAAVAGREIGMRCWALTGPAPNPLATVCAEALAVPSPDPQVVQELHLVSAHVLCEHVDLALPVLAGASAAGRAAVSAGDDRAVSASTVRPSATTGPPAVPATTPAVPPAPAGHTRSGPVRTGVEVVVDGSAGSGVED
ncbi:SIS domain-containing protein [Micromonospora sp. CPCC 206060]|uniref:D-sedoheptulose-7-phosphate isomerase n=1 Tax=Micromonospora sp. CPCC 206060 TaxID=3122406 RepID=UPI002FEE90EB